MAVSGGALTAVAALWLQMARDKIKGKEVVSREYTINLHKRLNGIAFKKKAPRAVKEIKKFAIQQMGTKDVRVDVKLNKAVWSQVRRRWRRGGSGAAACRVRLDVMSSCSELPRAARHVGGLGRHQQTQCAAAPGCLQGIKNVPNKLRIVISRKRNEDDEDSVSTAAVGHACCRIGCRVAASTRPGKRRRVGPRRWC